MYVLQISSGTSAFGWTGKPTGLVASTIHFALTPPRFDRSFNFPNGADVVLPSLADTETVLEAILS